MSSDPTSDDDQPEVDDGTLPKVVQQPIKAAGDLSEAADAAQSKTADDLARDLEAVASKPGLPSERELLLQILWRVGRIEQQLEKRAAQVPQLEGRSTEDMLSELMDHVRRIERSSDDLRERVGRMERDIDRPPSSRAVDSQIRPRMNKRPSSKEPDTEGPITPPPTSEPASGTGNVVRRASGLFQKATTADQTSPFPRLSLPPAFLRKGKAEPPEKPSKPEDSNPPNH
jgi:hypothetical protein